MPKLQLRFGGSFSQGNVYTSASGETVNGTLSRRTGGETLDPAGGGVQLAGGTQGLSFQPASGALTGATVDTSMVLEGKYIPASGVTQSALTTVLAAGGNIYLRYADATHLEYGFAYAGGHAKVTVAAPSAGTEHAVALAYERTSNGAMIRAFLDGAAVGTATSISGAAGRNSRSAADMGIGNDVHPSALSRGLKGTITQAAYTTFPAGAIPPNELPPTSSVAVRSRFGGSFSQGNVYTSASGETVNGTLSRRTGGETLDPAGGGVQLAGGTQGLSFQPASGALTGATVDTSMVLEGKYIPASGVTQSALTTVLAAGGNIYLRYADATHLEYGFAYAGGHAKVTVAAPSAGTEHAVALAYERTSNGAMIRAFLDGAAVGTATSISGAAGRNSRSAADMGIGNDVHPSALSRGLKGTITQANYTTYTGPFSNSLLVNSAPCVTDTTPVTPGPRIPLVPNECTESKVAKASKVRPTASQFAWARNERVAFLHFGVNTYTDLEWGYGDEDPDLFQPTTLDTDQWAQTLKNSGFASAILTVKHHDGFVLYPSRYTTHDVASSSWQNGTGDVVRKFADSMHKYGLKVGVYVSPADENAWANGTGIYHNGSARTDRTIPTLVPGDDRRGRDLPTFTLKATDYGAYMLNQLYEVLTQYGQIDEVWFDGSNGRIPADSAEKYDLDSWFSLIRSLAPQAVIANVGPDVRWVGNEGGVARTNEWSVLPTTGVPGGKPNTVVPYNAPDQGSRTVLDLYRNATQLTWLPAEADVSIRPGWFYHASQDSQLKDVAKLTDIYHKTVGRNAVLLLNIPPDRTGKINAADVARLAEWRTELQRRYSVNVATNATVTATSTAADSAPANAVDGSYDTSWRTTNANPAALTVDLGSAQQVDSVVLAEDIRQGQQVDSFKMEYQDNTGAWLPVPVPSGEQLLTIGIKRILPMTQTVTAQRFRLSVTQTRGQINLATLALYRNAQAQSTAAVRIMPVGDSITYRAGYRLGLWQKFTQDGTAVDFVGSVSYGPPALGDKDNEGHPGYRIHQIAESIVPWMRAAAPNTALLHIGTNDVYFQEDLPNAPARLSALLDKILGVNPDVELFVAQITPAKDPAVDARVRAYNAAVPGVVQQKVQAGYHVHLVDMYSALTTADLEDGVHPNAAGYEKMTAVWYNALRATPLALIPSPEPRVGVAGRLGNPNSGRCLDVQGDNRSPGASLILDQCATGANQVFTRTATAELSVYGDRCLEPSSTGTILTALCTGAENQKWTFRRDGHISSATTGKCMAPTNNNIDNYTIIRLADCSTAAAQRWNVR
ncbi:alpha-L-fucosidase (plasmid) [Streptosporangium sp. CA-135522]|uniref:alpha-L-fucosidase n=1 Tax=Streptosporangium sp. CA-135522 TaxID=3240072 RepID=UPI003D94F0B4